MATKATGKISSRLKLVRMTLRVSNSKSSSLRSRRPKMSSKELTLTKGVNRRQLARTRLLISELI